MVNGHGTSSRYSTRCTTGTLPRKRYDHVLDEEERRGGQSARGNKTSSDSDSESEGDSTPRQPKHRYPARHNPSRAKRLCTESNDPPSSNDSSASDSGSSDNDDDDNCDKLPLEEEEEEEEEEREEGEKESNHSSSDTEEYESDDSGPGKSRVTRASSRHTKSSAYTDSAVSRRSSGRIVQTATQRHDSGYRTRNQGRRTVRYREDSDPEGERERDREAGEEQQTDSSLNISSRGRVRKLTARARDMLR